MKNHLYLCSDSMGTVSVWSQNRHSLKNGWNRLRVITVNTTHARETLHSTLFRILQNQVVHITCSMLLDLKYHVPGLVYVYKHTKTYIMYIIVRQSRRVLHQDIATCLKWKKEKRTKILQVCASFKCKFVLFWYIFFRIWKNK